MNTKRKVILTSAGAGFFGFVNWLATVPPEQQSGWLAALVELTPLHWRPNVGLFTRFLTLFLGIYATYLAARSGPTPPPTPSDDKPMDDGEKPFFRFDPKPRD